jgi:hypothetical protein
MEVTFVLYHRSNILSQHTNHNNVPYLVVFYTKLTIIVKKTPVFKTNCHISVYIKAVGFLITMKMNT